VLEPVRLEGTLERGRWYGTMATIVEGDSIRGDFDPWRRPADRPPYRAEDIRFHNGSIELRGTLLLPRTGGRHPAIVFVHGSGPQTRESYLRYFADSFARRGIAALIYDKRNTGDPRVPPWLQDGGTFEDLAGDALAGVAMLRSRADIDTARIGIWRLSQGAWVGPLAASQSSHVSFVIMLSGGGVTPAEQERYDDAAKLKGLGYSQAVLDSAVGLLELADDYVRSQRDADWGRLEQTPTAYRQRPWFHHLDRFPLVLPREAEAWTGLRPILDYDPRPVLQQLKIPVLAILGELDTSTPTAETAKRIEAALHRAGNADFTVRIVPRADHALEVADGVAPGWLGTEPAPGWEEETADWVLRHVAPRGEVAR